MRRNVSKEDVLEEEFEISFSRTAERKGFSVLAITSNTFKVGYISITDKVNLVIFMTIINDLLYQIRFFGWFLLLVCFFLILVLRILRA